MNIKRMIGWMAVVTILVALYAVPAMTQTFSTIAKGYPAQVMDTGITGFAAPATPTITLGALAVKIGTMPANTVAVTLVASGAINFGSSSVLGSAVGVGQYRTIANGGETTIKLWPGTLQPDIYVIPNATGTTPTVRIIAHVAR